MPPLLKMRCEMAITRTRFQVNPDEAEKRKDARRKRSKSAKQDFDAWYHSLSEHERNKYLWTAYRKRLGDLWLEQEFHWDEWSERKRKAWREQLEEALIYYLRYADIDLRGNTLEERQAWVDGLKRELLSEFADLEAFFTQF